MKTKSQTTGPGIRPSHSLLSLRPGTQLSTYVPQTNWLIMSLKRAWTLSGRNAGGKGESSDLEMKVNGLDSAELDCKRLGTRYNEPVGPGCLRFVCINECMFCCELCWHLNVCEPSGGSSVHCARVLKGSISRWASVVARKAGFTPTHRFPHWPYWQPGTKCLPGEPNREGESSALPPPTRITPACFPLYPVCGIRHQPA